MPDDATFLREQADKCRWLAGNSTDPKIARTLRDLANEYEAKADALEAEAGATE